MYTTNLRADEYLILKEKADKAYTLYEQSGHDLDWEYFIKCETAVSDFALKYENEIWKDTECQSNIILK